jgi:hypothetical protein
MAKKTIPASRFPLFDKLKIGDRVVCRGPYHPFVGTVHAKLETRSNLGIPQIVVRHARVRTHLGGDGTDLEIWGMHVVRRSRKPS